jgi:hypothetical protein
MFTALASQMTAFVVPPARAGTSPQRWEYICKSATENFDAQVDATTAMANAYGREGWEMTGSGSGGGDRGEVTWCFKRPYLERQGGSPRPKASESDSE